MKARILSIIFSLFIFISISAQPQPNYGPNGFCFTPRGEFRMLVVFVGYGDNDTLLPDSMISNWPASQPFPTDVMQGKVFYTDYSQFNDSIDPVNDRENISRWFYEQSNKTFKLIADTIRVNIQGDPYTRVWSVPAVLQELSKLHQSNHRFNWEDYDKRQNNPLFKNDYSAYNPDNEVDYLAIIYRNHRNQNEVHASTGLRLNNTTDTLDGYTFENVPLFIQNRGATKVWNLFQHEVGHHLISIGEYGVHL